MDIKVMIGQILSAGVGALGFALMFNSGKKNLIPAMIGGMLGWTVYLICENILQAGVFISALATAVFCQIYSEILARWFKSPAIVFYIPAIVPIVPGGSLYYTMYSAAQNEWHNFRMHGWNTLLTVLGIAIGSSFVSAIIFLFLTNNKKTTCK